jgi:hypothetical protein
MLRYYILYKQERCKVSPYSRCIFFSSQLPVSLHKNIGRVGREGGGMDGKERMERMVAEVVEEREG